MIQTFKRSSTLLFVIVALLLSACQGIIPQSSTPRTPLISTESVFPASQIPDPIPQPESGKGSLIGTVSNPNPINNIGLILYLGDLIRVGENETGAFLDQSRASVGHFDAKTGEFFFENITPGEYSLIIYQVELGGQAYMTPDGNVQPIEIKANEIIDLGEIPYQQ